MAAGEWPEPVAMDFTAALAPSPAKVPRRIRRRMMAARAAPASVEEIEARLREAGARRQQFHEWLSCKAKRKPRSPSWSSQEEDIGQRLEAKLIAAEQKRLSLLESAQKRLARLDEIRQAAKSDVEMRNEKEREELCSRVESRVRQAEANRLRLLEAYMQRRAALKERKARSLVQIAMRERKYKELVRSSISIKRAAAEKKRLGFLEAEKTKAHARVLQAQSIARTVCKQREVERRKMQEQLEDRLQRAKRQRAEFLKQRGGTSSRVNLNKHGDFLSRKLARCWRRFVESKKTTYTLAVAFQAVGINGSSVKSMPFEQLALCIESPYTLQTTKALLDRLETRFLLTQLSSSSVPENIDHLTKHLASPMRKASPAKASKARGSSKRALRTAFVSKPSRYSVRVVLCAYMILGQPSCVLSGNGDREKLLMDSALKFVGEFEMLLKILLDRLVTDKVSSNELNNQASAGCADEKTFRSQLIAFDKAWCSYLYHFVVWKAKDARSLEEDLIRASCQLEISMLQTCKVSSEGQTCSLTHDMKAVQKQVMDDQRLIQEKVHHLSGDAGMVRLEKALSDARLNFFEKKGNGSPSSTPVTHIVSPGSASKQSRAGSMEEQSVVRAEKSSNVARKLFGASSGTSQSASTQFRTTPRDSGPVDELLVDINEILHETGDTFFECLESAPLQNIMVTLKSTIEKAFWDGVLVSLQGDNPDFSRVLELVKEVREELCGLAPKRMREEILGCIDLDILSQILGSSFRDTQYVGHILEYSLSLLRKLSSVAYEEEMKTVHEKLLIDLAEISQSDEKSYVIAVVKGLRFVLEEVQKLKIDVRKVSIRLHFNGPKGLKYLQEAFADQYGSAENHTSVPLTASWVQSLRNDVEAEWAEYDRALSTLPSDHAHPLVTTLRTGGHTGKQKLVVSPDSTVQPGCGGEALDKLLRVGLLKIVSDVEASALQTLPETLELNQSRLLFLNAYYRQVVFAATSMLVLRQTLISERAASNLAELEGLMSEYAKKVDGLLRDAPKVGVEGFIQAMATFSPTATSSEDESLAIRNRMEVMTRMLERSLQSDNPVFKKVSSSVYSALRGVVLGGSGMKGQQLADAALRRIGAAALTDRVMNVGKAVIVMAMVSADVHGPWYRSLT